MKQIPAQQIGLTSLLTHVLALPAFFLSFILFYQSEWMLVLLRSGHTAITSSIAFNAVIITCILIGVLCGSRIPMTACRKHISLGWTYYILWSLAEIVVTGLFSGLYITLISKGYYGYFSAVGESLLMLLSILIYPYVIINLLLLATREQSNILPYDNRVHFYDNTQRQKLVIASEAILCIEAEENYVRIRYIEGTRVKEYALRNSMRSIEPIMEEHGIIRCQRSYFVNPKHVKVLRRDKEGIIVAELDNDTIKPIPVSPKYYENLSRTL